MPNPHAPDYGDDGWSPADDAEVVAHLNRPATFGEGFIWGVIAGAALALLIGWVLWP